MLINENFSVDNSIGQPKEIIKGFKINGNFIILF